MDWKTMVFLVKGGAVGLATISVFLSYRIIRSEQQRDHSRRRWLLAGFAFMVVSFLVFIGGTIIDTQLPTTLDKRVARVERKARRMERERDELFRKLQNHLSDCSEPYLRAIHHSNQPAELRSCWRALSRIVGSTRGDHLPSDAGAARKE